MARLTRSYVGIMSIPQMSNDDQALAPPGRGWPRCSRRGSASDARLETHAPRYARSLGMAWQGTAWTITHTEHLGVAHVRITITLSP
jgi:hypothetical protein